MSPAIDRRAPLILDMCLMALDAPSMSQAGGDGGERVVRLEAMFTKVWKVFIGCDIQSFSHGASFHEIHLTLTQAFLTVSEQTPDANRGMDVPPAIVSYYDPM